MLQLIFGSLALFAAWATWPDRELRSVGLAVIFSFIVSNLIWFYGTPDQRPGVFTMAEVVIALSALTAWYSGRHQLMLFIIAVTATVSICCNISFALVHPITLMHINTYEFVTNILFALECVLIGATGISDRVDIASRSNDSDNHFTYDAVAKTKANDK